MNTKIKDQIEAFISKTNEKKIDWKFLNANAVRFTKPANNNKTYTVTLQSTGGVPPNTHYIFTIQSINPSETLLQVQTQNMPEYKELLKILFENSMVQSQSDASKDIDDLLRLL